MTYIVSGYFINGFTEGHKEMLKSVKSKMTENDKIIVIVNNEIQQKQKYISATRHLWQIYELIEPVLNEIFGGNWRVEKSIDRDRTVRETLKYIKNFYEEPYCFINDGDVTNKCPEEEINGIEFAYLGNPKISSSGEEKK